MCRRSRFPSLFSRVGSEFVGCDRKPRLGQASPVQVHRGAVRPAVCPLSRRLVHQRQPRDRRPEVRRSPDAPRPRRFCAPAPRAIPNAGTESKPGCAAPCTTSASASIRSHGAASPRDPDRRRSPRIPCAAAPPAPPTAALTPIPTATDPACRHSPPPPRRPDTSVRMCRNSISAAIATPPIINTWANGLAPPSSAGSGADTMRSTASPTTPT